MNLLQRNLQAWTKHREEILPLGRELPSAKLRKEFDNSIEKCEEALAKLVEVKENFNEQRTKAVALRDGVSRCVQASCRIFLTPSSYSPQAL